MPESLCPQAFSEDMTMYHASEGALGPTLRHQLGQSNTVAKSGLAKLVTGALRRTPLLEAKAYDPT